MDIEAIVKSVIQELELDKNKESKGPSKNPVEADLANHEIVITDEKHVGVDEPLNGEAVQRAQASTPARIGIGRAGTRMKTDAYLRFRTDHAAAKDAVFKGVSEEFLLDMHLPELQTKAETREEYLINLDSGRFLNEQSREWVSENLPKNKQVQIIVADGLSSTGIEENIPDLLPALKQGLKMKNIEIGVPVFVRNSRVWLQDEIASIVNCDLVVSLIGERPGLATSNSISAYMIYRPSKENVESDRTVVANIHEGGLAPVEAGAYLADLMEEILKYKASGVTFARLKKEEV